MGPQCQKLSNESEGKVSYRIINRALPLPTALPLVRSATAGFSRGVGRGSTDRGSTGPCIRLENRYISLVQLLDIS